MTAADAIAYVTDLKSLTDAERIQIAHSLTTGEMEVCPECRFLMPGGGVCDICSEARFLSWEEAEADRLANAESADGCDKFAIY